jgi:16S rRNA C967 or C1407 C5-methylase (RsmB/RsmF family)/NOL1/NOP2/fmu family ribosome biogenesis protein
LPRGFLDSLEGLPGFNQADFIATHQTGAQVVSIRLNPEKAVSLPLLENNYFSTDKGGIGLKKVPWSSQGYYLSERPSFTGDPLFHGGAYYVQEASSMFLEEVLRQSVNIEKGMVALDLCAAPGGKSTLLQSILSKDSLLVCNEIIKTRVNILSENMTKWGAPNVILTNNEAKDFQKLPSFFDLVVVDAPCSGSGLFRKDPAAIDEWNEQHVIGCGQRQQRILEDILPALKDEGILIYSTCSYSSIEDEQIADWLVSTGQLVSISLNIPKAWGIIESFSDQHKAVGYRFYPDQLAGEGFFIAAFKKTGKLTGEKQSLKPKGKTEIIPQKERQVLQPYISSFESQDFIRHGQDIIIFPAHLMEAFFMVQGRLYIKKAGVNVGEVIRNELIPSHELALSSILSGEVSRVEVDLESALQFLRREEIKLANDSLGWKVLTFKHLALGWVKILPNRVNNYYPKEWRILHK